MPIDNNSNYTDLWQDHSNRRRQELRQTELPSREAYINSISNTIIPPLIHGRNAPRSNTRTRIAADAIQNIVKQPDEPTSDKFYEVHLEWTCETSSAKTSFKMDLPHRKDINDYRAIPIIPFRYYPRSKSNMIDPNSYIPIKWPFVTFLRITTTKFISTDTLRAEIQAIPNVVVFDIWKRYCLPKQDDFRHSTGYTFNGDWFITVGIYLKDKSPTEARQGLPGFLKLRERGYNETKEALWYKDRKRWCFLCKPLSHYHSNEECDKLDCEHCGQKGEHKPINCSENPDYSEHLEDMRSIDLSFHENSPQNSPQDYAQDSPDVY